jgi:hypothetical protein
LLLPYLLAGVHVHGVEFSPDLAAICQAQAQQHGAVPTIHRQALDRLDLPMSFKTMYASVGIFQRYNQPETAEIILQKLFEHLEMNGLLIIALQAPQPYRFMQPQGNWCVAATAERSYDRARIVLSQAEQNSFIDQQTRVMERYDVFGQAGGVETYFNEHIIRWYYKSEFKLLLERAGFAEISVLGGYTAAPVADADAVWVFLATKRG